MPIAALDLFCGIGGLTHGLQLSGIPVIAGFDIDDSCRYAYEANNASEFVVADVANLQGQDLLDYYPVNTTKMDALKRLKRNGKILPTETNPLEIVPAT